MNFELNGNQYPLENPTDLLLGWAMQASVDEFKSRESLDKIATVIKAVCPTIPDQYFFTNNGYLLPLFDSYQIVDFVSKLTVAVLERRIKAVENLSQSDKALLGKDEIQQKIQQFKTTAEQITKRFQSQHLNLMIGGIQVKDTAEPIPIVNNESPKLAILKKQLEELTTEISSLERM